MVSFKFLFSPEHQERALSSEMLHRGRSLSVNGKSLILFYRPLLFAFFEPNSNFKRLGLYSRMFCVFFHREASPSTPPFQIEGSNRLWMMHLKDRGISVIFPLVRTLTIQSLKTNCCVQAFSVDTLKSSYLTLKYSILPNMRASQEVKVYISLET